MDLNTMAAGRSSSSSGAKAIKLIDGNLVTEDTDEWTPKGIMLTIDGIEEREPGAEASGKQSQAF